MLRRLESLACFLAALPALLIEGCFVYWIRTTPLTPRPAEFLVYRGRWISPTLPPRRLLGAVVALFHYLCRAMQPDPRKAVEGRRIFLWTLYWFLALASTQGCALYLDYLALVQ